jgi:hypothetical protein
MDEAKIGALASLATETATDCGILATLTEANARLTKQLEERSKEVKEVNALLKKERADRTGQRTFNASPDFFGSSNGYKVETILTSQSCNYPKGGHNSDATKDNNMRGSQENKE